MASSPLSTARVLWASLLMSIPILAVVTLQMEAGPPTPQSEFVAFMMLPNAIISVIIARFKRLPTPPQTRLIISYALAESVAIGGLMAWTMGARPLFAYGAMGLAALVHLVNFPTEDLLKRDA